jgi:hypothetical protein
MYRRFQRRLSSWQAHVSQGGAATKTAADDSVHLTGAAVDRLSSGPSKFAREN